MKVMAFGRHNIDIDMIADLGTVNSYWKGVAKFLSDLETRDTSNLTYKQQSWLDKIADQYENQYAKLFP